MENYKYILADRDYFLQKGLKEPKPLDDLPGITYFSKRYLYMLTPCEASKIYPDYIKRENINKNLGKGTYIYKIEDQTKELNSTYFVCLLVRIFDIYEPDTVRCFDLDWRSEKYLEKATPKILSWIDGLYREAALWKRMA